MARTHGIAILTLIIAGCGLWLVLGSGHDAYMPADAEPEAKPGGRTTPAEPIRTERTPSTAEATRPAAPPAAGNAQTADPAAAPRPTVWLSVYLIDDPQREFAFRWRFRSGPETQRGTSAGRQCGLALAPGTAGELVVEADGCQPWLKALTVPAVASELLRIDVGLQRAAVQSGVTLTFTDAAGAPVGRLRVEVWQIAADGADPAPGTDPPGNPLWSRTREQPDGIYRLPDLQPARYALLATAVDADGMPQPMRSFRTVFSFTGSEAIPVAATGAAGSVVRYTLTAGSTGVRQLHVRTRSASGAERPVLWRSKTAEGVTVATDTIRAPGIAAPHEALPPDAWTIEVLDGDVVLATTNLHTAGVVEQPIVLQ